MNIFSAKDEDKKKEEIVEQILLEQYDQYYRLAYSYVKNEADAGDIVQNGAYKAIANSHTLRQIEFAKTWVYRIMLNEIFQLCKSRNQEEISLEECVVEKGQEDTYEDFDLKAALHSLSKEDKAVIELRYFEEKRLEEIAEILNENLNTVKSRLYRGMKKLRLELERQECTS